MENKTSPYVIRPPRLDPDAKKWAWIVYILQAVSPVFGGITFVIAIVLNYIKRDDVVDTLAESHFVWQMRTFWFSVLWSVVGGVLMFALGLGALILVANGIWLIYRVVKGMVYLNDNRPMYPLPGGSV